MVKEEKTILQGRISKIEKNGYFVDLDMGDDIFAYSSGNIKRFKINLTVGDEVEVEVSPYDLTKGRIIKRL